MSDFFKKLLEWVLPFLIEFLNDWIEGKLGKGTEKALHHQVKLDHFLAGLAKDTQDKKMMKVWRSNAKKIRAKVEKYK